MEVPQKTKNSVANDPAIPLLDIYPEKSIIRKGTFTPMFIVALFTIAKTGKQSKCPTTGEWIKKKWSMYTIDRKSVV